MSQTVRRERILNSVGVIGLGNVLTVGSHYHDLRHDWNRDLHRELNVVIRSWG